MSYEILDNEIEIEKENENDELFDTNWISEYEKNEIYYSMFYPEVNKSLKVNILYVNKKKELEKIRETTINLLHDNLITKQEWIKLVKDNNKIDKEKYKLVSILVYNFELCDEELKNFFKYSKQNRENIVHGCELDEFNNKYDYMKNLTTIDDFHLSSTINCLQSVNNAFIIFGYDDKQNDNVKKIYPTKNLSHYETSDASDMSYSSSQIRNSIMKSTNTMGTTMGTTKRVRFSLLSPSKKTRRKK
jgi:hypothetical protein